METVLKRTRKHAHVFGIFLAVLAFALYLPTLVYGFIFLDDYLFVERSVFYAKPASLLTAFLRPVWADGSASYAYYRPASTVLYVLDGWLSRLISGEVSAWAFHLTNLVLLGGFVALLVAFLTRVTAVSRRTAWFAAGIFILHPALTGTTAWICGQNELLLGVFGLGSFVALTEYLSAYAKGHRRFSAVWLAGHVLGLWLALLTKENAIALPVLAAFWVGGVPEPRSSDSRSPWLPLLLAWAMSLGAWLGMVKLAAHQSLPIRLADVLESARTGLSGLLITIGRLTFPLRPLPLLPTIADSDLTTWLAGVLGLLALIVAILPLSGRPLRLAVFGGLWFLGFLGPTFYRVGASLPGGSDLNVIFREDRAFVATVGLLIVILQVVRIPARFERSRWQAALVALILALAVFDFSHILAYRSGLSFYREAVAGSPTLPFAHAHLGDMELAARDYATAMAEYRTAIRLSDTERDAHNNLGVAYLRTGDLARAEAEFRSELAHDPNHVLSLANLGSLLIARGDYPAAEESLGRAAAIDPSYSVAWEGLVKIYEKTGEKEKLLAAQRALRELGEYQLGAGI